MALGFITSNLAIIIARLALHGQFNALLLKRWCRWQQNFLLTEKPTGLDHLSFKSLFCAESCVLASSLATDRLV
jgi:hypothetical protein